MAARQVIRSVAELRDIVELAEPGAQLVLEVASEMPFDDVRQLWEAVIKEQGPFELYNVEMLLGKQQAADVVEQKIRSLEVQRDDCNGRIGCMNGWVLKMERSLQELEHIGAAPADCTGLFLLGLPPRQFFNLDQIGKVDADKNREEILDGSFGMPVPLQATEEPYWDIPQMRERARRDRRSLLLFNINFLKVKIDVLKASRDRLTAGINRLKGQVQGRMYMGCANGGFSPFWDLPMMASNPMD